jgi:hypothetical protein
MTMCERRYQVCCSLCESVGFERSREDAKSTASHHAKRCDGVLTVFDLMARKDCTDVWKLDRDYGGRPVLVSFGTRKAV